MMIFIPPPIGLELARQRIEELHAAAEQHRRLHPEPSPAAGRAPVAATTRRVVSGIRRVLMPAPGHDERTDGSLRPHDLPTR